MIVTNTFSFNRIKLPDHRIEDRIKELNIEGVRIAKRVAGEKVFVLSSVGPSGRFVEPIGDMSFDDAVSIFKEQVSLLNEESPDAIILETFFDIRELMAAIIAIRQVSDIQIFASMTFLEYGKTPLVTLPRVFGGVSHGLGVNAFGTNCEAELWDGDLPHDRDCGMKDPPLLPT